MNDEKSMTVALAPVYEDTDGDCYLAAASEQPVTIPGVNDVVTKFIIKMSNDKFKNLHSGEEMTLTVNEKESARYKTLVLDY
jgi:hypothetical protein